MTEYFDELPDFTIEINPPGERENMIHRIDPEELTINADDQCLKPETTASTPLSDVQGSVAPKEN
jgi:hypothetical protein